MVIIDCSTPPLQEGRYDEACSKFASAMQRIGYKSGDLQYFHLNSNSLSFCVSFQTCAIILHCATTTRLGWFKLQTDCRSRLSCFISNASPCSTWGCSSPASCVFLVKICGWKHLATQCSSSQIASYTTPYAP